MAERLPHIVVNGGFGERPVFRGLSAATRVKAVELLIARLADCIDPQTQTKHAHWNVKGPNFIALTPQPPHAPPLARAGSRAPVALL